MAGLRKVEFVQSNRGKQQVLLDGYTYSQNRVNEEATYWRCTKRPCKGKITTIAGFLRNSFGHDHPPSNKTTVKFVSTMRKRARSETTPMQQIFNDELMKEADQDIPDIPTFPSIKSSMYRQRRTMMPVLPQTLQDVDLQGPWSQTHDGKRFLLFSDGDADKMVVFSTEDQLRLLQEADTIYMDGTFTCCPQLWNQLYSLHARKDDQTYPLVYALLPDRQTTTYVRLFENLKTHVHRLFNRVLDPVCVQTDFEMAAIRAVEQSFPNADIKGCMFHYTQAIWRKTQQIGLAEQYKNDDSVKTWVRRAAGLPLLPMNEVQNTFVGSNANHPSSTQGSRVQRLRCDDMGG